MSDLVLFGASSFVGRLTAAYLAANVPPDFSVALAGRSQERLEAVRSGLPDTAADWPILLADSTDDESLASMAQSTGVVVTTVGPYAKYGMPLVLACAEAGTDYADLTGEPLFMRKSIDTAQGIAEKSGARIVHSCGFDSIPSDLGVLALHEAAREAGAGDLGETTLVVTAMRGGFSGGTIDSMKVQIDRSKNDPEARRLTADPYSLSPDRSAEPDGSDERDSVGVSRDPVTGDFLAPFVMASVNTRVVRRSNALMNHAYGPDLRYREVMKAGSGPIGAAKAAAVVAGLGGLVAGLAFRPTRALLDRLLPDPGEGPQREQPRERLFPDGDHHDHKFGPPLPLPDRSLRGPRIQSYGGDARGGRTLPRSGPRPDAEGVRGADARHRDGRSPHRPAARRRPHLRSHRTRPVNSVDGWMELAGVEPATSWVRSKRSAN